MCTEILGIHKVEVDRTDFTFRIILDTIENNHSIRSSCFLCTPQQGGKAMFFIFRMNGDETIVQ